MDSIINDVNRISQSINHICNKYLNIDGKDEEVKRLDNFISCLESTSINQLSELRTRRNQLAWINQFPDDILTRIFLAWEIQTLKRDINANTMGICIPISRVCRRWRTLIVNNPIFWRNIDIQGSEEFIQEVLTRSKYAELNINHRAASNSELLQQLLQTESHRIRSLTLCMPSSTELGKLKDALQQPTPKLRHFSMVNSYCSSLCLYFKFRVLTVSEAYMDLSHLFQILFSSSPWGLINDLILPVAEELEIGRMGSPGANSTLDLQNCFHVRHLELDGVRLSCGSSLLSSLLGGVKLENLHTLALSGSYSPMDVLKHVQQLPVLRRLACNLSSTLFSDGLINALDKHITFENLNSLSIWIGDNYRISGISGFVGVKLPRCTKSFRYHKATLFTHNNETGIQFQLLLPPGRSITFNKELTISMLEKARGLDELAIRFECARPGRHIFAGDSSVQNFQTAENHWLNPTGLGPTIRQLSFRTLVVHECFDFGTFWEDLANIQNFPTLEQVGFSWHPITSFRRQNRRVIQSVTDHTQRFYINMKKQEIQALLEKVVKDRGEKTNGGTNTLKRLHIRNCPSLGERFEKRLQKHLHFTASDSVTLKGKIFEPVETYLCPCFHCQHTDTESLNFTTSDST